MWLDYIKERSGIESIETGVGFATYSLTTEHIYLIDLYIRREFRNMKEASKLADKIAEIGSKNGRNKMLGSVDIKAINSRESMLAVLHYGMKPIWTEDTMVFFEKEI